MDDIPSSGRAAGQDGSLPSSHHSSYYRGVVAVRTQIGLETAGCASAEFLPCLSRLNFSPKPWEEWIPGLCPGWMYLLPEQSSLRPGIFGTPPRDTLWIRFRNFALRHCRRGNRSGTGVGAKAEWSDEAERATHRLGSPGTSWHDIAWILGPFSLSYVFLLMPRGAFDLIQDRYLVGLVPAILIVLLKLYQEQVSPKLPAVSMSCLLIFATYSVAGTHDFYAESRAQVHAIQMVENTGVPRKSIQAGFPSDGWIQIENGGHINEARIKVPAGAYNPKSFSKIPKGCRDGFTNFAPVIDPKYFILFPWFKNPLLTASVLVFCPGQFPSDSLHDLVAALSRNDVREEAGTWHRGSGVTVAPHRGSIASNRRSRYHPLAWT